MPYALPNLFMQKPIFSITCVLVAAVSFAGPPVYTSVTLPTLGGRVTFAEGINNLGQVVGYSTTQNEAQQLGFVYSAGHITSIPPLAGDSYCEAAAINNLGVIIGFSHPSGKIFRREVIQNVVKTTTLPNPPVGSITLPIYINDSGTVLVNTQASGLHRCFVLNGTTYTSLGFMPNGTFLNGTGINNSGTVIGYGNSTARTTDAFTWKAGVFTNLASKLGSNIGSQPNYIASDGTIVGHILTQDTQIDRGFIYSNGYFKELGGVITNYTSDASGINLQGVVTGISGDRSLEGVVPFLNINGLMTTLDTLAPESNSTPLQNETGQIVGIHNSVTQTTSYLLTPQGSYGTFAATFPPDAGTVTNSGIYPYGTKVTLSAKANVGYVFKNWVDNNGIPVPGGQSITIQTGFDRLFVANFTATK